MLVFYSAIVLDASEAEIFSHKKRGYTPLVKRLLKKAKGMFYKGRYGGLSNIRLYGPVGETILGEIVLDRKLDIISLGK